MSELDRMVMGADAPRRKTYFFFGPPGSGKTELALSHKGKRKLWLDVDEKLPEVYNPKRIQDIKIWTPGVPLVNEIQAVQVDSTRKNPYAGTKQATQPEGYLRTVKVVNELIALARTKDVQFPFDLIVLDTITTLVNHMEMLVLQQHNVSLIQETLYEVIKRNLKTFVDGLLRLPCDIIVIGHSKHVEKRDRTTNAILEDRYVPLITGSYAGEIGKSFSEMYFFTGRQGDQKWYIQTGPDKKVESARTAKGLAFEQEIDASKIYA